MLVLVDQHTAIQCVGMVASPHAFAVAFAVAWDNPVAHPVVLVEAPAHAAVLV